MAEMNEEQAREWDRLAEVERAESPDGKTGWDRFLERHVHPAERRHGDRRQRERRQPSEVPEAVRGVSGKGGTHSLHVFTPHPQDYELIDHREGTRWRGTASGQWRKIVEWER